MKNFLTLVITLGGLFTARAQSLSPTVVATSGGFAQNNTSSLSYTIGEMTMVKTFSSNNNILTQGFQQPTENVSTLIDQLPQGADAFVLYPNPAVDNVWCGFQFDNSGRVNISLKNELGQEIATVYQGNYQGGKDIQQINVNNLAAGTYFLNLNFTSEEGKISFQSKKFIIVR